MKKKSLICLIVVFCLFLLTSCNKKSEKKNNAETISIFTYTGQEYEGIEYDSVIKTIEEKVGYNIEFSGASTADYYTRLSPMISSLDLPDAFWVDPGNSGGAFDVWSDPNQELLYNLDDLLIGNASRYPYLTKLIYSDQYKNITFYGNHYLIPNVETSTAWAIYYRADWLKQIGFVDENGNPKAPVTLDEFEYVMKAFTGNNLFDDGTSGQTYGISPNTAAFYVNPLYHAFDIITDWDIDDEGNVEYMYCQEGFKDYLKWMSKMYQEGWIDPTFNQNVDFSDRDKWYNGQVGCIMTNGEAHMEWVVGTFENSQGTGKVLVGPPLEGTGETSELTGCKLGVKGAKGYSNWGGFYGGYVISQNGKDPYKMLDLFEYLVSPEGSKLRLYGIEGKHYTVGENGVITPLIEERESELHQAFATVKTKDGENIYGGLHKIGSLFGHMVDWDYFDETKEIKVATDIGSLYPAYGDLVRQAIEYTQYLKTSKFLNVSSPTVISTKMNEVKKISNSLVNKVITGSVTLEAGWAQMEADIKKAGYDTVKAVLKETAIELGLYTGD